MARVKRGVTSHAKHKKVLKLAKGFYGRRKNTIRTAKAAVDKAGQYAYRDRRVNKRNFRSLWIQRINAAARTEGFTYSQFIHGLVVGRHRHGPQGAVGRRHERRSRLQGHRRQGARGSGLILSDHRYPNPAPDLRCGVFSFCAAPLIA